MTTIDLDADGTRGPWIALLVASSTGVEYAQQCGGVACERRTLEGSLVPLGGMRVNAYQGRIDTAALTAVFHRGRACLWGLGKDLANERVERLREEVAAIPCWLGETRAALALDEARRGEIVEAWVPVGSPYGPAVLVWNNCD